MADTKKIKGVGPNGRKKAAERQAKLAKFFGILLIATAVVSAGYWTYSTAYTKVFSNITDVVKPKIAINGYDIKGCEGLDSKKIEECLKFDETANFFNTSTKEITKNLAKIEGIETVKVNKKLFSQVINVKITKRVAKYQVNIGNQLYWADKNGFLWQGIKNSEVNTCLVFGLKALKDSTGKRIDSDDFAILEKTFERIRGTGKNSDNIKTIHFKENDVTIFTASNISVEVRINGTLKYGSDDFEYFESVLRKQNRTPMKYLDAYENCVYAM